MSLRFVKKTSEKKHFGNIFLFKTFLNEFSFFISNNVFSESCRLNLGNVNLTTKVKDSDHRLKQVNTHGDTLKGTRKSRVTIPLFQEEEEEDEVYGRALNLSSSSSSPRQSSDQLF
jgi:hypothetical protein